VPRRKPETGGWEETHQRVTFYCPVELAGAIAARSAATGRSKTQLIVDALRAQFPEPSASQAKP
jgi:hypothetical protein